MDLACLVWQDVSGEALNTLCVMGHSLSDKLSRFQIKGGKRISLQEFTSRLELGWSSGVVETCLDLVELHLEVQETFWRTLFEWDDTRHVRCRIRIVRIVAQFELLDVCNVSSFFFLTDEWDDVLGLVQRFS